MISARNIEIYCPDKWKRKTRPKNEKTSISCIQEGKHKTPSKTIAIDTQGIAVDEESMPVKSADDNMKVYLEGDDLEIQKHYGKSNNVINGEESVDITAFPQYQELLIQNNELKEALEKATQLVQANKLHDNFTIDFEFSLSYEDVQRYVSSMLKVYMQRYVNPSRFRKTRRRNHLTLVGWGLKAIFTCEYDSPTVSTPITSPSANIVIAR